jgi:endonuclease/exonuclease/phosphatase family metal-dependent hydrolase
MAMSLAGCAAGHEDDLPTHSETASLVSPIPAWGSDDTLDLATWNVEWFGHTARGPSNEGLQLANVAAVLSGPGIDLWALQEIVYGFGALKAELPEFEGIVSNDSSLPGSNYYYNGEQKLAFLWRPDVLELLDARVILVEHQQAFAGRPPLEAHFRIQATNREIFAITLHGKASTSADSWMRRQEGGLALAAYLASERAGDDVVVLGDFNDDLDESIRRTKPSPYEQLVDDFFFATLPLALADVMTSIGTPWPLDHALLSGSVVDSYVATSAEAWHANAFVSQYSSTTSDHYPVRFRIDLQPAIVINEILANEPGSDTDQEAIELVNPSGAALDLGGWTLSDNVTLRHVFPVGTVLAAGKAIVVTADANIAGVLDTPSSTGSLGLNNAGDTVFVRDENGQLMAELAFPSGSPDGVSFTRAEDGDASADLVHHTVFSSPHSLGKRKNGSSF